MAVSEADLAKILQYIEDKKGEFIKNLKDAVAIRSVSAWKETRDECVKIGKYAGSLLEKLGFNVSYRDVGEETHPDGTKLKLPPIILAEHKEFDPNKTTLLVYGHLDVQPAKKSDGWNTEPFDLTQVGNNLFGRGSTDDKGPVLGWLHALQAYKACGVPFPVNLKFVLEAMEECGSEGLEALLISEKDKFLSGVHMVTISDNYWLGTEKPCLTYGLRGICYVHLEVEGGSKDLHSGSFGGAVREAMADLIYLMDSLVDKHGNITVPGIMDSVLPLTDEEKSLYSKLDFNCDDFKHEAGVHGLRHGGNKESTLMHRWRYPTLSLHGIEGDFSDPGSKTVIPKKVIGKFSLRLVPNQNPEEIEKLVTAHLKQKWAELGSPNKMTIHKGHLGKPWMASPKHPNYQAASKAIHRVYKEEPQFTREGGSIPITLVFQELTGRNVLLLPMGQSDDGAHSQNEKISVRNYIEGTKVFASYLAEVEKLKREEL